MGVEIERKYKVKDRSYRAVAVQCRYFKQGYISTDKTKTIRIRIADDQAFITIKGGTTGFSRLEFEYPIPVADAEQMLSTMCASPLIEKRRYIYPYDGHTWEIDEFMGDNEGLVVAEVELGAESEPFAIPPFIGDEVTGDVRYYNSNLSRHPYTTWRDKK